MRWKLFGYCVKRGARHKYEKGVFYKGPLEIRGENIHARHNAVDLAYANVVLEIPRKV